MVTDVGGRRFGCLVGDLGGGVVDGRLRRGVDDDHEGDHEAAEHGDPEEGMLRVEQGFSVSDGGRRRF